MTKDNVLHTIASRDVRVSVSVKAYEDKSSGDILKEGFITFTFLDLQDNSPVSKVMIPLTTALSLQEILPKNTGLLIEELKRKGMPKMTKNEVFDDTTRANMFG